MQTLARYPELFVALAIGAVLMMTQLGLTKGLLAPRRARRPCPSCGRMRRGAVCEWCGHVRATAANAPRPRTMPSDAEDEQQRDQPDQKREHDPHVPVEGAARQFQQRLRARTGEDPDAEDHEQRQDECDVEERDQLDLDGEPLVEPMIAANAAK